MTSVAVKFVLDTCVEPEEAFVVHEQRAEGDRDPLVEVGRLRTQERQQRNSSG